VSAEPTAIRDGLPPGPYYALRACAVTFGALRGPILLRSSMPDWEQALRNRIGDQLFTADDPGRPQARAWIGAVWIEPQVATWHGELREITAELPGGALLSIVVSLPRAFFLYRGTKRALGARPSGLWQLKRALIAYRFRIERSFGFHTPWWSMLQWIADQLRARRPDLSDRFHDAVSRRFASSSLLPLSATGLVQARAGMRP
jgi:hypothetical protein